MNKGFYYFKLKVKFYWPKILNSLWNKTKRRASSIKIWLQNIWLSISSWLFLNSSCSINEHSLLLLLSSSSSVRSPVGEYSGGVPEIKINGMNNSYRQFSRLTRTTQSSCEFDFVTPISYHMDIEDTTFIILP